MKAQMKALIVIAVALAAGCGKTDRPDEAGSPGGAKGSETAPAPGMTTEPVTLTFFTEGNSAILAETIERLVSQKYPNVTLRTIKSAKGTLIEDVMGAGTSIDLLSYSLGGLGKVKDYKLVSDLTPLMQKYGFDTSRFADGVLDTVKSYFEDGTVSALPFELNNNVLFYNKGIFDKFGVSYPKDGMTWEQVYDLAKKVTRTEGGVQYKGFQLEGINLVYKNQMGLGFVDPKTLRATVNNDPWKKWIEQMAEFYKIPGNEPTNNYKINFLQNQTLAMSTGPNFLTEIPEAAAKGLDWDVVQLPQFAGLEGKGGQMNAPYYAIPPSSKNKDSAFLVMQYLLSDEVQTIMARQGRIPIVKKEEVRKEYAKDLKGMEGKNIAAFFKDTIGAPVPSTKYDAIAKSAVNAAFNKVATNAADANTALRQAEEDINKQIDAEKAK
ncbi:ABC transporter substrate-binding protein [Paenibacillus sp. GYB003]|uniref:ABC transporter substrate-binding protein n=1 Tax=Paenibacillus sp. GYB003 TaxID=2994392 RepID=UPI002F9694B0